MGTRTNEKLPSGQAEQPVEEARLVPRREERLARGTKGELARGTPMPSSTGFGPSSDVKLTINGTPVRLPFSEPASDAALAIGRAVHVAEQTGGFRVAVKSATLLARLHVLDVGDAFVAGEAVCNMRDRLLEEAQVESGGQEADVQEIRVRVVGPQHLNVDLVIQQRDTDNQGLAQCLGHLLAPKIATLTGGKIVVRVMSSAADFRMAAAAVELSSAELGCSVDDVLKQHRQRCDTAEKIAAHNTKVLEAIELTLRSRGQDHERIVAGATCYSERRDTLTSLVSWKRTQDGRLWGQVELPVVLKGLTGNLPQHCALVAVAALAASLAELIPGKALEDALSTATVRSTERLRMNKIP